MPHKPANINRRAGLVNASLAHNVQSAAGGGGAGGVRVQGDYDARRAGGREHACLLGA